MKKKNMNLKKSILVACLISAIGLSASENKQTILEDLQKVSFIKNGKFQLKDLKDLGNVYAIKASHPRMPKLTLFITKDKKTVILGNGFDNNGKIIEFPTNMSVYKADKQYTIGNGKKEYYLFTDPECPYCRQFEKKMDKLKDDIKMHVFLFPLGFHKHSIEMSKYIMSQKNNSDKAKAMKSIANGGTEWEKAKYTKEENKKYEKMLDKYRKIGIEVGVRGTPAVFSATGKAIAWPNLLKK